MTESNHRVTTAPSPGAVHDQRSDEGAAVSIDAVDKVFDASGGEVVALSNIALRVTPGEFVSVLGPSGCGKSTLLHIIAGLETPTAGSVKVFDRDVTGPVTEVGMVFQRDLLMDWRTVLDNILVQLEIRGDDPGPYRSAARELLESTGVGGFEKSYPRELSGGMRQRVALCRALIHDPALLLMDEPFGALDAITRDKLNDDLSELTARTGKTVVFITHSVEESVFLSDRVIVLSPRPGMVLADIAVDLPRPRPLLARDDPRLRQRAQEIREVLEQAGAFRATAGAPTPKALP